MTDTSHSHPNLTEPARANPNKTRPGKGGPDVSKKNQSTGSRAIEHTFFQAARSEQCFGAAVMSDDPTRDSHAKGLREALWLALFFAEQLGDTKARDRLCEVWRYTEDHA